MSWVFLLLLSATLIPLVVGLVLFIRLPVKWGLLAIVVGFALTGALVSWVTDGLRFP